MVFSHISGSKQSASVVIIQLFFDLFNAVEMASFFGEVEVHVFFKTQISGRAESRLRTSRLRSK